MLNFAILTETHTPTLTGFIIHVTTSTPCHLYMYWTITEPLKHKTAVFERGIWLKDSIRYCFVNWHQNEQEEAGDTLTHTFIKEPWLTCETRWFTFRGTVGLEWSPSVGPIFKLHRKVFIAPALFNDFDARSGWIIGYVPAHDAVGAFSRSNWTSVACYQELGVANQWQLRRAALFFDTRELPPAWNLSLAKLYYTVGDYQEPGGGPLCFLDGSGIPLICYPTCYGLLNSKTDVLASIGRSYITEGVPRSDELDADKLYFIHPGSVTIIAAREYHDLIGDGSGPPQGDVWGFSIDSFEHPVNPPFLFIYSEDE